MQTVNANKHHIQHFCRSIISELLLRNRFNFAATLLIRTSNLQSSHIENNYRLRVLITKRLLKSDVIKSELTIKYINYK
jgi:hypothetical protein